MKLQLVLREKGAENVEPTLIFDYKNSFLPALNHYALAGGLMPDPCVYLQIGSAKKVSEIDASVPIYVTVASCRVLQDLKKINNVLVGLFIEVIYLLSSPH